MSKVDDGKSFQRERIRRGQAAGKQPVLYKMELTEGENERMKRFLALLLIMMLVLTSFAACGSNEEGEATDPGANNEQGVEAGGENVDGEAGEGDAAGTEGDAEGEDAEEKADADQKEQPDGNQAEQKPADKTDKPAKPAAKPADKPAKEESNSSSKPANKAEIKAPSGTPAEIIDKIYAEYPVADLPLGTMEVDLADLDALKMFTGLSSADKIKAAAVSETMMGSQAYSLVVVKAKDAKYADDIVEEMANGIDPRKWVCVEADDLSVASAGDVVVLMMVESTFKDTVTSKNIIDAFSAICGGLDTRI